MRRFVAFTVLVIALVATIEGAALAWQPPVNSGIVDPWRPPESRYSAGNRGVDFAPPPGSPVVSAGPGTVSFSWQVGGINYVVVEHDGGIKTTYGGLASPAVEVGQRVDAGDQVGGAGLGLHFGVRIDGRYVDPNLLFGHAQLVPLEGE